MIVSVGYCVQSQRGDESRGYSKTTYDSEYAVNQKRLDAFQIMQRVGSSPDAKQILSVVEVNY